MLVTALPFTLEPGFNLDFIIQIYKQPDSSETENELTIFRKKTLNGGNWIISWVETHQKALKDTIIYYYYLPNYYITIII